MIYIISEENDLTTDLVIEWLIYNDIPFKRINDIDFKNITLSLNNVDLFDDATKIWQRRGRVNFLPQNLFSEYPNKKAFLDYTQNEESVLVTYVENEIKEKLKSNYIGSFIREVTNNKLINLKKAKECGFCIPKTLVTNNKKKLLDFIKTQENVITKDLRSPVNIRTHKKWYTSTGVKIITSQMLMELKDNFAPILVQELIKKEYEVRVFVFCNLIYSMAIFSQNDEKTKIDFRNYNKEKPNRNVPVILPKKVKNSIQKFMKSSNLKTGSIDLIVSTDNKYYFLEINPMGQYHWLSENCNLYVEKEISNYLANEKKEISRC